MDSWLKAHVWPDSDREELVSDNKLLLPVEWVSFLQLTPFLKRKLYSVIAHVRGLRESATIYPEEEECMRWAHFSNPENIKIVILGQDPYHGAGQANGLAFSVHKGCSVPPSLRNIYRELERSFPDFCAPSHGCLDKWAERGVLLLNTTLTVESGKAGSHLNVGWTWFTNHIISQLSENLKACCFMLWGAKAIDKVNFINATKHLILKSQHPSPLAQQSSRPSQHSKFIGNNHFVEANRFLASKGLEPICWDL